MNKLSIFKRLVMSALVTLGCSMAWAAPEQDVFDLILGRIQSEQLASFSNITSLENDVQSYLSSINADGSFPDINYADKAQSSWSPVAHLDRVKKMAVAYSKEGTKYSQDAALHATIVKALEFWHAADPRSTNWYNQQIGCPQRMGLTLIILRKGPLLLPAELENKIIARMEAIGGRPDQGGSQGTGANKTDIAIHWIYRACLTKNKSNLSFGVEQVYYPLFYTTGEGFQHDFSYMQHGQQLYIGGYGNVIIGGISNIATHMRGTEYAVKGEQLEIASSFLLKMFLPIIRGQHFHYNVSGRSIARPNSLYQAGVAGLISKVKTLDPGNTVEYDKAIKRLRKEEGPGYGLEPTNRIYWRSDYTLHQRPEYSMDVRLASTRTLRNENGNGENLKGYFLTDGAYDISIDGDEYVDIFPTWDWALIPGTTTPARTSIPKPGQWGTPGKSTFAGGASDGKYGALGFAYTDFDYNINTSARKAWFFFDKEIVCLGANIKSTATETIRTSINQCLSKEEVMVATTDKQPAALATESATYTDLDWVLHNRIGYFFPQKGNITVKNMDQTGSWQSIGDSYSSATVTKKVFSAYIDHGTKPAGDSYQYIIVPNITPEQATTYDTNKIKVIANTDDYQAVKHTVLNRISIIFYKPSVYQHEGITIQALNPCAVMAENIDQPEVILHVSDPAQGAPLVQLKTKFPQIADTKIIDCQMPASPYAGSTICVKVNAQSADFIEENATSLVAVEDAYIRNGSANENVNYGTASSLVVKNDVAGYGRQTYIKFDLNDLTLTPDQSTFLQLYMSSGGASITSVQWKIHTLKDADDNWNETAVTWKNGPSAFGLITTITPVPTGNYMQIDVTEAVRQELSTGNKILSIYIVGTAAGTGGKGDGSISSRESSVEAYRPQLIIKTALPELALTSTTFADGVLSVSGTGGYTPYRFTLTKEGKEVALTSSDKKNAQFSIPEDGDYRLTVADAKGEKISRDVMISKGAMLEEVMTFAALTDLHFGRSNAEKKVSKALQYIKEHTPKIDAIFASGDLTNNGHESEYQLFKTTFDRELADTDIPSYFCLGNHDRYNDKGSENTRFQTIIGQPLNQVVDIKGYPVMLVSMENSSYSGSYVDYSKRFVEEQLARLNTEYAGKPIFLFAHMPIVNTVYGSYEITGGDSWGNKDLETSCANYPQLVFFSGHSHYPMGDERSIHQGKFTSVGLGSLAYLEMEPKRSEGIHPPGTADMTESAIVTIYNDGSVKVKRMNFEQLVEVKKPWVLQAPHDGTKFAYKDRTGGQEPTFAPDNTVAITPDKLTSNSCEVSFPQATDDDMVHRYRITTEVNGTVMNTYTVVSRFYMNAAMPNTLKWNMTGLLPETTYKVKVYAVDSYGLESAPIESQEFTTPVFIPAPGTEMPQARLFDISFRPNGTAADISESKFPILTGSGSTTTLYNSDLKQYMARFNADNTVYFKADYNDNQAFKDQIASEFSIEVYTKTTGTGTMSSFSSQQSGGFGLEQASNAGATQFWAYINGGYKKVGSNSTYTGSDEYHHMVFTYSKADGKMKAYYNGVPGGETSVSGNLTFASSTTAQWLCVGGDANTAATAQAAFKGDVVFARIYDKALTRDEAFLLQQSIETRKQLTKVEELNQLLTIKLPQMVEEGKPSATRLLNEGWELMARLTTTDEDIAAFITKVENPESIVAPKANLLDVKFRPDRSAVDISENQYPVVGKGEQRSVMFNPIIKQYVFETKESTANYYYFNYAPLDEVRMNFKSGFTAELYCKTYPATNSGKSYSNPIGATEMGGWNIESPKAPTSGLQFYLSDSPTYPLKSNTSILTTPEEGTFHHIAMVFDREKNKLSGYIDGVLVAEKTDASLQSYREPAEAARWLCIGGDASTNVNNACQSPHWGEIGVVRLYKEALSYDEIIALYDQVEARKLLTKVEALNTALTTEGNLTSAEATEGWALMDNLATTDAEIEAFLERTATSTGATPSADRKVWVINGRIIVSDNAPFELFRANGQAYPTNVRLSQGVYIVKFADQHVKVVVD